jgi:hypothetical protein
LYSYIFVLCSLGQLVTVEAARALLVAVSKALFCSRPQAR